MTRLACTVVVTLGVFLAAGSTARAQDFEAAGKHFSAAQEAFERAVDYLAISPAAHASH